MKTKYSTPTIKTLSIPVLILVCLVAIVPGAGLSQQVHASAGDHLKSANAQISQTIGEPLITTESTQNGVLTQGMQQSKLEVLSIQEAITSYEVTVYPNPTQDVVFIDVKQANPSLDIILFDANGNLISATKASGQRVQMSLEGKAAGTYILTVINANDKKQRNTFQVIKSG